MQQRSIRAEARGECFREPRLRQELGRLIEAWQLLLQRSAPSLLASTSDLVRQSISQLESVVGDLESFEPRSLHYNNLTFLTQGPLQHQHRLADWLESFNSVNPLHRFTLLRDLISLFPRNDALLDWMASALQIVHPTHPVACESTATVGMSLCICLVVEICTFPRSRRVSFGCRASEV